MLNHKASSVPKEIGIVFVVLHVILYCIREIDDE